MTCEIKGEGDCPFKFNEGYESPLIQMSNEGVKKITFRGIAWLSRIVTEYERERAKWTAEFNIHIEIP